MLRTLQISRILLVCSLAIFALYTAGCESKEAPKGAASTSSNQKATASSFGSQAAPHGSIASKSANGVHPASNDDRFGIVLETIDASTYTYIKTKVGAEELWIAGPKTSIKIGTRIRFPHGLVQNDFSSPTLKRTFAKLELLDWIAVEGQAKAPSALPMHPSAAPAAPPASASAGAPQVAQAKITIIPKAEGGVTIEELFTQSKAMAGKELILRGKVVKFSPGIMGRNWLHIQDGTGAQGQHDLTITTQDSTNIGDIIIVRGKLSLNRDFGAGYRYDVILEEASINPKVP